MILIATGLKLLSMIPHIESIELVAIKPDHERIKYPINIWETICSFYTYNYIFNFLKFSFKM